MRRLTATVRVRHELGEREVARMYALYSSYYDGTSFDLFRSDLAEKQCVIELTEGDALCGFSTLALIDFEFGGAPQRAIFSGDTIIDHRYWGEQALPEAFCRFAGRTFGERPAVPLYWFLISKGYRTFRYLSLFARRYVPHPRLPAPEADRACLDLLARLRFGDAYDAERGVIRFPVSRGHLKPQWADVREALRRRSEVDFFLARNPGYRVGEELACLTRLEPDNLRSFARRAFIKGLHDSGNGDVLSPDRGGGSALPGTARPGPVGTAAATAVDTGA